MAKLVWDRTGEHLYETGVKNVVLYPMSGNTYGTGVAWNGVTSIEESPSGADFNAIYADDIKYLNIQGAEEFGATIGAYTYPEEFAECDGYATPVSGVAIGQQARKGFGLCYRTTIGNDTEGIDHGYKLHIVYGARVTPSGKSYSTVNESPEPAEMSWELNTTPVAVTGMKPTSILTIDSTKVDTITLQSLEDILYGTVSEDARLPLPDEVLGMFGESAEIDVVLNRASVSVQVGKTVALSVTAPAGETVTWASSDTSKATVSNGVVTGVAAGSTTITASVTKDAKTYSDTCAVTVTAAN